MDFRWLALIALWTLLAGPIFAGPGAGAKSPRAATAHATVGKH